MECDVFHDFHCLEITIVEDGITIVEDGIKILNGLDLS